MTLITKTIVALGAVMMLGAVQASPVTIHKPADVVSFGEEQNTAPIFGFDSTTDLSSGFGLFGQTLLSNNDSGFALGLRSSSQRFSILSGKGEGSNFAGAHGFGADQTYFHGGSWQPFSYRGFDWSTDLGAEHSFGFARVEIDSSGLERRSAEKVSFSGKYFGLAYTQVDRAAHLAAQSIDLSLNLDAVQFDAKHFTTVAGGQLNELVATWAGSAQDEFRLSLSVQENDLLEDGSDSSLLFQYKRKLGVQLNQAETKPAKKRKGGTSALLLGGGLVAAALGGSSGSSDQDNSSRFTAQDSAAQYALRGVEVTKAREDALKVAKAKEDPLKKAKEDDLKIAKAFEEMTLKVAEDAEAVEDVDDVDDVDDVEVANVVKDSLDAINPRSVIEYRVYAGYIYQSPDGKYLSTEALESLLDPKETTDRLLPAGSKITAEYHTHTMRHSAPEMFDQLDINFYKRWQIDGYLSTPLGKFLWYDVSENKPDSLGGDGTIAIQPESGDLEAQHKTARDILDGINPQAISETEWYAGLIYRSLDVDGMYGATKPVITKSSGVPPSTELQALYHTSFPRIVSGLDVEILSKYTKEISELLEIDSYVSTPLGKFLWYDFSTDMVVTLGGDGYIAIE